MRSVTLAARPQPLVWTFPRNLRMVLLQPPFRYIASHIYITRLLIIVMQNSILDLFPLMQFVNVQHPEANVREQFEFHACRPSRLLSTATLPQVLQVSRAQLTRAYTISAHFLPQDVLPECIIYRGEFKPSGERLVQLPDLHKHNYLVKLHADELTLCQFIADMPIPALARIMRQRQGERFLKALTYCFQSFAPYSCSFSYSHDTGCERWEGRRKCRANGRRRRPCA